MLKARNSVIVFDAKKVVVPMPHSRALKRVAYVFACVAVVLVVADLVAFKFGGYSSCMSDHMGVIRRALDQYAHEHDGSLPPTLDAIAGRLGYYSRCSGSGDPFIYLPNDVTVEEGQLLVMCPKGSHGFLRRFGFGLVRSEGGYEIVRLRGDGQIVWRRPMY